MDFKWLQYKMYSGKQVVNNFGILSSLELLRHVLHINI